MAKIRDIKVKLTADMSRVQQVIDQVRAEMEKALKPFNPPRMYIVQDDDESQSIENIKGLKADMAWFDDYASKWDEKDHLPMDEQKYFDELKTRLHKEKATSKGLTVEQYDKGQPMAHDKPNWNVDQILAEAHRVKGEYEHDRRKYRHSMSTTGTMRVPAALVVEMLGRPVEWNDETERIMRGWEGVSQSLRDDLDGANEEINTLRKQLAERRYFNETEEIAALKAKLLDAQAASMPSVSPEERAVLEAAMCKDVLENATNWVNQPGLRPCNKPLYRAIIALHEAGENKERHTAYASGTIRSDVHGPFTCTSARHIYHDDGHRLESTWKCQKCGSLWNACGDGNNEAMDITCCGNTLHFA